ncbi:MAG: hypothetical protein ACM3WU_03260 [Bacillota bacterium]
MALTEPASAEPPEILSLIRLWAERAEGQDVRSIRELIVRDFGEPDGEVTFEVNIHSWKPERYAEPHVMLRGSVDRDTGRIVKMSAHGSTYGSPFTKEKIALLRPYAETMIGALDMSLTREECGAILDELKFSEDDLSALEESLKGSTPETERNGVRYSLRHWGSEEGGTVEVVVTRTSPE